MGKRKTQIGLWMVGACGGVGGTVALGLAALSKRLVKTTGLVTALPEFAELNLVNLQSIVVGGHEIRSQPLLAAVKESHEESAVFRPELIKACTPILSRMQQNIRPGILYGAIPLIEQMADPQAVRRVTSPAAAVEAVRKDLLEFKRRNKLEHVVVVNVASSEPPARRNAAHGSYAKLERAMRERGSDVLPSSALYAMGAFAADCSYINFTPSVGSRIPAIEQFAGKRDVLYGGRDGKTGETLLKSVLAPMFMTRNLALHSWIGHNVLGNRDGAVLNNPKVKESKIRTKDGLLSKIVGYVPETRTSIEYVPSLKDWKVAWDFIHFEGFLDTKMSLQFVWNGSDSLLAAPLVIDLARLTAHEFAHGRRGRMDHLSCFFKDPEGEGGHDYAGQWRAMIEHLINSNPAPEDNGKEPASTARRTRSAR